MRNDSVTGTSATLDGRNSLTFAGSHYRDASCSDNPHSNCDGVIHRVSIIHA